jgi:dTDP-4-dehydrorhamnose 3,5-epimerase
MQIKPTEIPDVMIIEPRVFRDERGFNLETYQAKRYAEAGIPDKFVQDNHSGSRQRTLRGLHYQIRQPQGKLVQAIAGEIFDVVVDLRRSSPTFGRWQGANLSAQNKLQLWVPAGFAHGFYVVSEWAELIYKTTDYYAPEWERTLLWNDPDVGIDWQIPFDTQLIISPKDKLGKPLKEAEVFD